MPERLPAALAEARLQRLVELRHPAVGQLLDWGRDQRGHLFVLREDVPGEPLPAYIERRRTDASTRVRLLEEARAAIRVAHAAGVVHGRLSARRILVVESDEGPSARVVGFEKGPRDPRACAEDDLVALDGVAALLDESQPAPARVPLRLRLSDFVRRRLGLAARDGGMPARFQ